MKLKIERNHKEGLSNIDYRTNKDKEKIKFYNPWKNNKDIGTMGNANYKIIKKELNSLMKPSENLNMQKDIFNERPSPKYYDSAVLYKELKLPIMKANNFKRSLRDSQLIGLEGLYEGDSMMIAENNKIRKNNIVTRLKSKLSKDAKSALENSLETDNVSSPKINKDLVHSMHSHTVERRKNFVIDEAKTDEKINLDKLKDIRNSLRKRYAGRTNVRKIFNEWDHLTYSGEIDVYEAKNMINRLGIPINYNESLALIASSNKRNTQSLNLEEFVHLIKNDDNNDNNLYFDIKSLNSIIVYL